MTSSSRNSFMKSGIECITADDLVKRYPERYWGRTEPKVEDAIEAMRQQLELIGCDDVKVLRARDWWYVGTATNWINPTSSENADIDVLDVFQNAKGLPEAGGTSLRAEYFIHILSEDIVFWGNGKVLTVKGKDAPRNLEIFQNGFNGLFALGIRGNTYEN